MTLYHSATSPYVRKVMVLAHEAGLLDRIALVPASGTPLDPGTVPVGANPLGKVPVLTRPDGGALYDSRVICRYLDALAGHRFYPTGARQWDCLTLEATADGMLDAALLMVYESRLRPDAMQMPQIVEGHWSKIARSLATLEERWMAYLAGPLCMGQIALACALGYLDLRHGARGWRDMAPQLGAWQAKMDARDAMIATAPPN
ncbi:glutathione S-transferase [Roseibaca sp. Y0-43]|uniref:glutathione S-transferase n=1 Tax=Roseibaca sp. Y0-43 TaxID=2816854 RepID=UPI001D0C8C4C|nr:glutathione S-transferase [Roseibaca sp. Y0-43]MCC1480905.1 glutathione S-transferase [Roseibaca sp. Y0-43]